jgi:hypothetical protein
MLRFNPKSSEYLQGRVDANEGKKLRTKRLNESDSQYNDYVYGFVSLKVYLDMEQNIQSGTSQWPDFAIEEYNRIYRLKQYYPSDQ